MTKRFFGVPVSKRILHRLNIGALVFLVVFFPILVLQFGLPFGFGHITPITGNSMFPAIWHNDRVIVLYGSEITVNDIVVAKVWSDENKDHQEYVIKTLADFDPLTLESLEGYNTYVDDDIIKIVGKVVVRIPIGRFTPTAVTPTPVIAKRQKCYTRAAEMAADMLKQGDAEEAVGLFLTKKFGYNERDVNFLIQRANHIIATE